ncbi:MAG: Gfo/Idh/MocA family protein [Nitrososphaeria archaeon]
MRFGVIGVGRWGQNHVRALKELGLLYGVFDVNRERAEQISRAFDVKAFESLEDEELKTLDAAVVAVPATLHHEVAIPLIKKGLSLLIEKPAATSKEEVLKISTLAKEVGVKVGVGYIERFNPAFLRVRQCVKRPVRASFYRISPSANISDVGVVFDLMIHDINLSNYLFGRPEIAYRKTETDKGVHETSAEAVLNYGTVTSYIAASWKTPGKMRKILIYGDEELIEADLINKKVICQTPSGTYTFDEKPRDQLKDELEAFARYIRGEAEFPDIDEAVVDVEVAERVLRG